jgi:hypothetical protein
VSIIAELSFIVLSYDNYASIRIRICHFLRTVGPIWS